MCLIPVQKTRRLISRTLWDTLRSSVITGVLRKSKYTCLWNDININYATIPFYCSRRPKMFLKIMTNIFSSRVNIYVKRDGLGITIKY